MNSFSTIGIKSGAYVDLKLEIAGHEIKCMKRGNGKSLVETILERCEMEQAAGEDAVQNSESEYKSAKL